MKYRSNICNDGIKYHSITELGLAWSWRPRNHSSHPPHSAGSCATRQADREVGKPKWDAGTMGWSPRDMFDRERGRLWVPAGNDGDSLRVSLFPQCAAPRSSF
jgi:hypothetical protein